MQRCGKAMPDSEIMSGRVVRAPVAEVIRKSHPEFSTDSFICLTDLHHFRSKYMEQILEDENGELGELEQEVVRSIREHELLTENLSEQFASDATLGERIADKVAEFGGSWRFIILFGSVLVVWILVNSIALLTRPFDPFPFILLNLVLSCLAAIQAPVIMMSQNRQQSKDRLQSEHDYRVNLKAELEIRHLNAKVDLLLTHQWQRLMEVQQLQTDLIEELGNHDRPDNNASV